MINPDSQTSILLSMHFLNICVSVHPYILISYLLCSLNKCQYDMYISAIHVEWLEEIP